MNADHARVIENFLDVTHFPFVHTAFWVILPSQKFPTTK